MLLRMLEVIAALGPQMRDDLHRRPLLRQVEMIHRQSRQNVREPDDLIDIEGRYESARRALLPAESNDGAV